MDAEKDAPYRSIMTIVQTHDSGNELISRTDQCPERENPKSYQICFLLRASSFAEKRRAIPLNHDVGAYARFW